MKRTGDRHMGHIDEEYKLNGKATDHPHNDCRDRSGLEAYAAGS
jgi:hypothetical protein